MTLDEALAEMADVPFDENLPRVALGHICGSIFFTADGSDRRCAPPGGESKRTFLPFSRPVSAGARPICSRRGLRALANLAS